MKQRLFAIMVFSLMFSMVLAKGNEKYKGLLVDKMCASNMIKTPEEAFEKGLKHTRFCALEENCVASGFGILLKDGTYILFDESGNKKAENLLRKMTKKNNLLINLEGKLVHKKLSVKSLNEAKK